jgi:uncharacterized protein YecE (DUF72 family)
MAEPRRTLRIKKGTPRIEPADVATELARELAPMLAAEAARGVRIGTSSWKYDGWQGIVYANSGGKEDPSNSYLRQYARIFPTVCADFTFYRFYDAAMFRKIAAATPAGFTFAVKVTQSLLINKYPHWFKGENAGKENADFLSPKIFVEQFLAPVQALGDRLGPVIFEFGEKTLSLSAADLILALDDFFAKAPAGPMYAVEIRRPSYFTEEYFGVLRKHRVAHVINSQETTLSMREQIDRYDVFTAPFSVIRALTPPKISYKKSVEINEPFDRIVSEQPAERATIADIARLCREKGISLYAYINNRLEGCSPLTIAALLKEME